MSPISLIKEKQRTSAQNNALHKYFELIADELNEAGLDMRVVLKPEIEIPWSKDTIKDYLWRPIQIAQLQKVSTIQLTTRDLDKVFDTFNKHIGKFGIFIPFPSIESLMNSLGEEKNG